VRHRDISRLLASYPRQRPALPEAYQKIYREEYRLNRDGATLTTRGSRALESWMHVQVAGRSEARSVLEIGAGTLNHTDFQRSPAYDVVEPAAWLIPDGRRRSRVRTFFRDIRDVPASSRYERIISIAVLEHVDSLPEIIARSGLLLAPAGMAQHAVPSEGGALWGLTWRLTTGLAYWLRNKLSYGPLMRHEHINTAPEIVAVFRWFFERVTVRRFPLPLFHSSFYTYIEADQPKLDRCHSYLEALAGRTAPVPVNPLREQRDQDCHGQ
jgi:methyltransferase family protein